MKHASPATTRAQALTPEQTTRLLEYVSTQTRFRSRNAVIVLLGLKAGLRSQDIAAVTWRMVTDEDGALGDTLRFTTTTPKGSTARDIPLNPALRDALLVLRRHEQEKGRPVTGDAYLVTLAKMNTNLKSRALSIRLLMTGKGAQPGWFTTLGFEGMTSHALRRTFIINAATQMSSVGGSLRDVQTLAGHRNRAMTAKYVVAATDVRKTLVSKV
jgi:integrase/recombinase XerD